MELIEFKTKGYKAKNLRDFWYDREIADIKSHLTGDPRAIGKTPPGRLG